VKCEDANVNGFKSLHFITFSDVGGLNRMRWEMLQGAECEMLRCKYERLQTINLQNLNYGTITVVECGKEHFDKCYIFLSVIYYDTNVNGCKTLNFGSVTDGGFWIVTC